MPHPNYSPNEIVERGRALYDQQIRDRVEAENRGRFLVINVETGEYVLDDEEAWFRKDDRRPGHYRSGSNDPLSSHWLQPPRCLTLWQPSRNLPLAWRTDTRDSFHRVALLARATSFPRADQDRCRLISRCAAPAAPR